MATFDIFGQQWVKALKFLQWLIQGQRSDFEVCSSHYSAVAVTDRLYMYYQEANFFTELFKASWVIKADSTIHFLKEWSVLQMQFVKWFYSLDIIWKKNPNKYAVSFAEFSFAAQYSFLPSWNELSKLIQILMYKLCIVWWLDWLQFFSYSFFNDCTVTCK